MFNLWLDYPSETEEIEIVRSTTSEYRAELRKLMNAADITAFQDLVRTVPVADNVIEYAVRLVGKTRPKTAVVRSANFGHGYKICKLWRWSACVAISRAWRKSQALLDGRYTRRSTTCGHLPASASTSYHYQLQCGGRGAYDRRNYSAANQGLSGCIETGSPMDLVGHTYTMCRRPIQILDRVSE